MLEEIKEKFGELIGGEDHGLIFVAKNRWLRPNQTFFDGIVALPFACSRV
jgi:hypothetical protein